MNNNPPHNQLTGQHPDPELIATWLDDPEQLDAEMQDTLATHLSTCTSCRQLAEDLIVIVEGLGALPPLEPAQPLTIQRPVPVKRFPLPSDAVLRWAAMAASVLLVLSLSLGGLGLFDTSPSTGGNDAMVAVEYSEPADSEHTTMMQEESEPTPAAAEAVATAPAAAEFPTQQRTIDDPAATPMTGEIPPLSADSDTRAQAPGEVETPEPESLDTATVSAPEPDRVSTLQLIQLGLLLGLGWILLALLVARRRAIR